MPRLSKKPRSQGVEPSPTPMMPTVGRLQHRDLDALPMSACARIIAVIHPAEPPPTMTIFRIAGGMRVGLAGCLNAYE